MSITMTREVSSSIFKKHLQHNPQAQHYLLIGPHGQILVHSGGEASINDDLPIHPKALFDAKELIYGWFDHILKRQRSSSPFEG